MDPTRSAALRALLASQPVAALATLHRAEPAVSMVPYALLPDGRGFVIHVSRLATHTADLLAEPAVGLLVVAPADTAPTPHELARVSIRGRARPCPAEAADHEQVRACYLARFPEREPLLAFADFSLFVIEPRSIRHVGGFAQAASVSAAQFAALIGGHGR